MSYRLAVVSDVHADVHALTDALGAIDRMGCEGVVCCGDVVDYGLFPDETIALLSSRKIPSVRGNHDRWAVAAAGERPSGSWGGELSAASRVWLRARPASWSQTLEGVRVTAVHGSPRRDMEGIDPDFTFREEIEQFLVMAQADVLLCGHTHHAFALRLGSALVANPAALLRDPGPGEDGPPSTGTFGVLTLPERRFEVFTARGERVSLVERTLG